MNETNPRLVGVFVLGALGLLIAAIVLFSDQDLFEPKREFVAYFSQSVNGLNVGAPVRFRGIPVGEVLRIDGVYDPTTGTMLPRVTLQFLPETLENAAVKEGEYTLLPLLLESGLRASLNTTSLLTGQLYVSLDFRPNTPERRLGRGADSVPELPTVDSGLDQTIARLSELPFEEVLLRASRALGAVDQLLRNPALQETLEGLPELVSGTKLAVEDLRRFAGNLSEVGDDARDVIANAGSALRQIDALASSMRSEVVPRLDATLEGVESAFGTVEHRLAADSPLVVELSTAIREIRLAARSVRELADTLEENPETLLRGKSGP